MNKSDFYYDLPERLIAQTPIEPRNASRLMVLGKQNGNVEHKKFTDLFDYLKSVLNGVCSEEYPRKGNENKDRNSSAPVEKCRVKKPELFPKSIARTLCKRADDLIKSVQSAPKNERPICSVP